MHKIQLKYIDFDENQSPRDKGEAEHLLAHSTLKIMLWEYFGIENPQILKNENGKPYIEKEGVHFSIAHSNGLCAVAVADLPIGIDCEKLKPRGIEEIEKFANRFFVKNEIELLEKSDYALLDFYKIWTGKEATIKKLGVNFSYVKKIDTTKENLEFFEENNYIVCINI